MEIAFALSSGSHSQLKSRLMVKEHFPCGTFSYPVGFVKRSVSKQTHVIKLLGALRTDFTYAPVLLFELYPARNHSSMFQTGDVATHPREKLSS